MPDEELFLPGRFVYQKNCEVCHGYRGDGQGPMGLNITPKPRNFSLGIFKYRSTPMEFLPTDQDLMRTVRQGLAGTAMPSFQALPEKDIRAVIEYVKSFSPRWNNAKNYAAPLKLPNPPDWFDDEAAYEKHADQGKQLYEVSCLPCHGPKGDGNGPSAATLIDSWNQPIKPADLCQPTPRSGSDRTDIFRTLTTGVAGTPMASFAEATTEVQRWELVAYLERLRRTRQTTSTP